LTQPHPQVIVPLRVISPRRERCVAVDDKRILIRARIGRIQPLLVLPGHHACAPRRIVAAESIGKAYIYTVQFWWWLYSLAFWDLFAGAINKLYTPKGVWAILFLPVAFASYRALSALEIKASIQGFFVGACVLTPMLTVTFEKEPSS